MKPTVDESICVFGSGAILRHTGAMRAEMAGVREAKDIEYVHRMRVASRRLRTALAIFLRCLPSKKLNNWQKEIRAITKALGPEYIGTHEPWMASEGYGMYLKYWPGIYAFVGIQNEEFGSGAPHHNTNFDIDEAALPIGACGTLQYILDFLENDKPIRHTPETRSPDELTNAI